MAHQRVPAATAVTDGAPSPGAIVRRLLAAYSNGDEQTLLRLVHPEMEFVPMLVATGARRAPYRGHAGFAEYLRDSRAVLLDVDVELRALHEDEDVVVALAQITGSAAGGPLDAAVTYVFRIRDGLVVHGIVGSDPDRAARAFRVAGAPPELPSEASDDPVLAPLRLHLDAVAQSVPTIRRAVDAYAGAAGAPTPLRHDICLAVSEACSNVVLHAYLDRPDDAPAGSVTVTVRRDARRLHLCIEDEGRGMIARVDSPGLGLGLVVMSRVAAQCTITTRPEREAGSRIDLAFELSA